MNQLLALLGYRVSLKQKSFLIKQLALMLSSGVPIITAISLAAQQTDNDYLRQVMRAIVRDVESGHAFSAAVAQFPDVFDPVMVAMIKSAEASGNLQQVLTEMATQLERDIAFTSKVRNSLLYPGFIVFVMIIVGIIMTTVVVPRLTSIFDDASINLPWSTQVLVSISHFIINDWYLLILGLVAAFFTLRTYFSTTDGKTTYYRLQTKIPVLKTLVQGTYLVRLSSILAMLIKAGVPITDALTLVADSLSNRIYVDALHNVRSEVERGIPLSTAMARYEVFPKPLTQMLSVGEQTGKLEEALDNMARVYEEQTSAAVTAITALIEPSVLLIVAVAAGFVVIAVILPIYGLANQF